MFYFSWSHIQSTENRKDLNVAPQGVHKEMSYCRLCWLTSSALVYEPKCGGGGVAGGVSAKEYSCAHGAQIIFGDLTLYETYVAQVFL